MKLSIALTEITSKKTNLLVLKHKLDRTGKKLKIIVIFTSE